jgi:hypothetical protein
MDTTLNLAEFRGALQSGGLRSVGVTASGGLFFVTAQPRSGGRIVLATTRGKQRRGFRDAGKAIAVLHDMGVRKVEVDTSEWLPEQAALSGPRRPDTALRQRRAHKAIAYDTWFRAQIAQSLKEADAPDAARVSQEHVKRESATRRAAWLNGSQIAREN